MTYTLVNSLITSDKYSVKSPRIMKPLGICFHNTSNKASARNEINYMKTNNNKVSYHVAIDDIESIQSIPFTRMAYHAGTVYGNDNFIGIEICYSTDYGSDRFAKAELNAIQYGAKLCKEFGFTIDDCKYHVDFSGKQCPHRTDRVWFMSELAKAIKEESYVPPTINEAQEQNQYEIARRVIGTKERCKDIQAKLIYLGYDLGSYGANGIFGNYTFKATKKFQADNGLDVDGWFGNQTYAKLTEVYARKVQEANKIPTTTIKGLAIGNPSKKVDWVLRLQAELNRQKYRDLNGRTLRVDGYSGAKTLSACEKCPLTYGCRGNITRLVQEGLKSLGYFTGVVDGVYGNYTKAAIIGYNKALGYGNNDQRFGGGCWKAILGLR